MIDINIVHEFMVENFENVSVNNNGTHWIARCLLCGDSKKNPRKKRFNLDYNHGNPGYHCFNCGRSGSFVSLYSEIKGIPVKEVISFLKSYDGNKIKERIRKKEKKNTKSKNQKIYNHEFYNSIGLRDICHGVMEKKYQKILKDFYDDRKVPKNIELRISLRGRYKGRILIPVIEDDKVLYFQGRSIFKNPIKKYLNPAADKNVVLNKDKFDLEKYIIIVEGLLDAYVIGNQATTCLGSYISEDFIKEVFEYTNKGIIILFDNDGPGEEARKNFILNNKFRNNVKYFLTPKKFKDVDDINNIVRMYNVNSDDIYEMIVQNSYKLHVIKSRNLKRG